MIDETETLGLQSSANSISPPCASKRRAAL
jgi:hypothetical protein